MATTRDIYYEIGVGIADVTDPAIGLAMQGMADPSQKTSGVEFPLYSRAFVIAQKDRRQRIAIAIADIWACTAAVKTEVVKRLQLKFHSLYKEENILIAGTHTHSGPGGFSKSRLYEHVTGGFDPHTFECVVSGIAESIEKAHFNLEPGRIYIGRDRLPDCGRQRSRAAYLNNPLCERLQYDTDADEEMLLLKFVAVEADDKETPIGLLNWHAIHPTDRGQNTSLVNGDNKGYAAYLFEKHMYVSCGKNGSSRKSFVAAFANANCGDVSGNVEFGCVPNGTDDCARMRLHGEKLFAKAVEIFDCAAVELRGQIDTRHTRVDMANVAIEKEPGKRTWPAALGLSFAAGSTEDSVPRIATAGITFSAPTVKEGTVAGQLSFQEKVTQRLIQTVLSLNFGTPTFKRPFTSQSLTNQSFIAGQWPKPVILAAGRVKPPIVPSVLPLQLITIGELAIAAVPGELSTMAGRRLRETLLNALKGIGTTYVALATYANDYSLYITTKEEYEKQHYEGAVTLYGPYTLAAYQQEFFKLATALAHKRTVEAGAALLSEDIPVSNRLTIRSLSEETVTVKIYRAGFEAIGLPLEVLKVPAQSDRAYFFPKRVRQATLVINNFHTLKSVRPRQLVTIRQDKTGQLSGYTPRKTIA